MNTEKVAHVLVLIDELKSFITLVNQHVENFDDVDTVKGVLWSELETVNQLRKEFGDLIGDGHG